MVSTSARNAGSRTLTRLRSGAAETAVASAAQGAGGAICSTASHRYPGNSRQSQHRRHRRRGVLMRRQANRRAHLAGELMDYDLRYFVDPNWFGVPTGTQSLLYAARSSEGGVTGIVFGRRKRLHDRLHCGLQAHGTRLSIRCGIRPYGKTDLGFASHAGYPQPARARGRAAYKGGRS